MNAFRRRRYDQTVAETSIWDVYNNVADIRDDELIKDWNDSLNFLLVFAAIFAAVLTALIVESMRLLREDPQDVTNALLLQISNQLSNRTVPAYHQTAFEPPAFAVIVNALLFASICCSLIAALAAVLALQWVNEYDARIDTVDAKKRALIRHFRFLGVQTWKMGEIIAMLPLLLHASVFLFFAGIVVWMNNLHPLMYYICIGGAAVAATFYTVTVIFAASFSGSPFRSPMARGFRYAIFKSTSQVMRIVYKLEFSFWVRSFLEGRWYTPPRWLHGRLYTLWSSLEARRDAKALEEKETQEAALEETTVTWTARHVEFTSQSTDRLVHILKDATPLFGETSLEGPWVEIMDHISGTCLEKAESQQLSAEDHAAIGVTLAAAMAEYFRRKPSFDRAMDHGTWDRWENTLKLAGPFLLLDDVDQLDMTTFVSILQSRSSTNGKSSAAQLVRATRSLVPVVTTGPERWITSYAIYSLCVYLWTHEHNRSHRQVADRLIEIIDIPSGDLHIAEPNEMCMSLALSALYSVAFGKPERERHFWASAHTLYPVGRTDERSRSVKALNSVLTSHIASAAAQETSQDMVQLHLKSLCRLLAYTPCLMEHNKEVERFTEILERLPHRFVNQHHPTHESSFPALPSVIWLHKVTKIPRIHEYLEVILACQVRFPKLKPVWRSWHELDGPGENNRLFAIFGHDKRWLDQFVHDRRITQVLRAFDQLVDAGCSITQHVTMIQLAIHDLSDDRGGNYSDYYTKERNAELEHLQDPALRLIGARAAGIAYSGTIPHELAPEWSSEPWIEAVRFWCETYRETDGPSDGALLRVALLQSNDVLHSAVIETSSENRLLQDRIRELLASELDNCVDTNTVLLLHVAAQTAAWFPQYLTETRIQKLVGILDTAPPLDMRVLPVLATLLALIQNPLQAITVLNSAQHVLLENDQYPGQNEVCELTEVVERMILMPPQWLEPDETKEENASRQIWAALNEVSRLLQEPDNAERAVVRWSGIPQYRPKPRQRQLSSLGVEEPFEGRASEDYRGLTDLVSPYGLGTRLLGLLHHSEDGRTSYEGRSLSINNPGAMSQQNVVGMDGDQESIEAVEGSGDRLYSCSAAWDI